MFFYFFLFRICYVDEIVGSEFKLMVKIDFI